MAINIQEILHPSDSNQIKWEKVNYNFDQILANGGGPAGSKGNKGSQGSVGQTGAKGTKGDQGIKGDSGSTSSRWETITIDGDSNGIAEYVILKPKLESDAYHPVIFLGDQTFDNVNGVNGETRLRSTLTIGHHAEGGNSPSQEFLTFWHGERGTSGNNVGITISSEERVDDTGADFTRFRLDETYGINLNTNPAEVLEFYAGMDRFVFNTDVSFDSADAAFQFPATLRDISTIKAGMVRYYGGAFQGAVEDSNGNITWTPFCMSPCGGGGGYVGTISLDDNTNLTVGPDGSQLGSYIEISGGDIDVDLDGDPWNGAATTTQATTVSPTTFDQQPTTQATTTTAQTIAIAGTSWTPSNTIEAGGLGVTLSYEIDGVAGGQILSSAQVTTPTWVSVSTYSGGSNNDQILMEVLPNAGGQRNGTITIAHPNNSSVTDSVSITQASGITTTQATTQATTNLPAPVINNFTAVSVGVDEIETLWDSVTGATGNLTITWGTGGSYTNVGSGTSNSFGDGSFNLEGLSENTTYYIRMTASNAGGSTTADAITTTDTQATTQATTTMPSFTITYDANGGSVSSGTGTGPTTGTLPLTVASNTWNKTGYSFNEWNTHPSGTGSGYSEGATYNIPADDTLYATWTQDGHTVTYINGNYESTSTCQLATNTKTAFYTGSSAGNFLAVSNAIMADNDYTGSTGIWCKVVSSTEGGFQWSNHIFNHAAPMGASNCETVLATTTVQPTTVDSGSGGGTCYQYTLYNAGSYFVGGSLNNVPNCNGTGNVSIGVQAGQSTSICTTATPPTITIALGNIGGSNVTISGSGIC